MSSQFDNVNACAALVQRGDKDRFLATMTARPDDRAALFVLFAFNLEVSRAPWVTKEPIIAEMRLQWWLDAIEEIYDDKTVRRHEVVTPLAQIIRDHKLPRDLFDHLIGARRWDIYSDPHADEVAFAKYIRDTSGILKLAHLATGGSAIDALDQFAYGAGVAGLLRAIPALENAQKYPLVDGTSEGVVALAQTGLDALSAGKRGLKTSPKSSRAALRSVWWAQSILKHAAANPALVANGHLDAPQGRRKLHLMALSAFNRF